MLGHKSQEGVYWNLENKIGRLECCEEHTEVRHVELSPSSGPDTTCSIISIYKKGEGRNPPSCVHLKRILALFSQRECCVSTQEVVYAIPALNHSLFQL